MNCCSDLISFFGFFRFTDLVVDFPAGADCVAGVCAGVGLSTAPATGGSATVRANAPPASSARAGQERRVDEIFVMNSPPSGGWQARAATVRIKRRLP